MKSVTRMPRISERWEWCTGVAVGWACAAIDTVELSIAFYDYVSKFVNSFLCNRLNIHKSIEKNQKKRITFIFIVTPDKIAGKPHNTFLASLIS